MVFNKRGKIRILFNSFDYAIVSYTKTLDLVLVRTKPTNTKERLTNKETISNSPIFSVEHE